MSRCLVRTNTDCAVCILPESSPSLVECTLMNAKQDGEDNREERKERGEGVGEGKQDELWEYGGGDWLRRRLILFYSVHNPAKINTIETLVKYFAKGRFDSFECGEGGLLLRAVLGLTRGYMNLLVSHSNETGKRC